MHERTITASFGVAVRRVAEPVTDLVARAAAQLRQVRPSNGRWRWR